MVPRKIFLSSLWDGGFFYFKEDIILKNQLNNIKAEAEIAIKNAQSERELSDLKVKYLGKKGELTAILKQMGKLSAEERPIIGAVANEVREFITALIESCESSVAEKALAAKLISEKIDVTLPGHEKKRGRRHPLSIVANDIKDIFIGMGFTIATGPEVEYDYYNFEALNIPKDHPARDTQDTFYVSDNIVLRTQTSPMQIRYMEKQKPPIKMISPGRVFRNETIDATHSAQFFQIEGLVVDKGITMIDLKATLEMFAKGLYGDDITVRFRPHHFPFTEPSAEVDVLCFNCKGDGCRICKGEGFIEILGAGMVHPKVLERCGIDPDVYSGFAFGLGLDRVTMLRYNINDLRIIYDNDMRFLSQF